MPFQICPLHTSEEVDGEWVGAEVGWRFTCPLTDGHPTPDDRTREAVDTVLGELADYVRTKSEPNA